MRYIYANDLLLIDLPIEISSSVAILAPEFAVRGTSVTTTEVAKTQIADFISVWKIKINWRNQLNRKQEETVRNVFKYKLFGAFAEKSVGNGRFARFNARCRHRRRKVIQCTCLQIFACKFHLHILFRFLVHRNVMLASSAYFNTFLASSNDMETDHVEITLSKMTGATLKTIIDYCYSGHADITGDNIDQVMTAALDMKLIHLEQMCKLFWNENEDIENSVHKLMFASKFNLNDLWNNLLFFICHKFDEIPIAAMVQLDHDNFDAILKEDEIAAAESDIFECFVRWVQHDEINRLQFVVTIAPSIRLELLSKEVNQQNPVFFCLRNVSKQ